MSDSIIIKGNIADIPARKFFSGNLVVENGRVSSVERISDVIDHSLPYILPGFIDSHVHIESSMLVPSEFARLAVVHGTVATVSDPHEIANVCGVAGVEYMVQNAADVNFKFYFGAPSCVPATTFETAGDAIDAAGVKELLRKKEIRYLSEMMNFPGVISKDEEVMKKITAAHEFNKPVDGHAPGLRGEPLKKYVSAGISTMYAFASHASEPAEILSQSNLLITLFSVEAIFDFPFSATQIPLMKVLLTTKELRSCTITKSAASPARNSPTLSW